MERKADNNNGAPESQVDLEATAARFREAASFMARQGLGVQTGYERDINEAVEAEFSVPVTDYFDSNNVIDRRAA